MTRSRLVLVVLAILGLLVGVARAAEAVAGQQQQAAMAYLPLVVKKQFTSAPIAPVPPPDSGAAGPVAVLANQSQSVDDLGYLNVYGEVWNTSPAPLRFVKVVGTLLDQAGQAIDTDNAYPTGLRPLPSGQRECFGLSFGQVTHPNWARYTLAAEAQLAPAAPTPRLAVVDLAGAYDPRAREYRIRGEVRNDDARTISFVEVHATLYDAANTVVGCQTVATASSALWPGQASAFRVVWTAPTAPRIASQRVQAYGTAR